MMKGTIDPVARAVTTISRVVGRAFGICPCCEELKPLNHAIELRPGVFICTCEQCHEREYPR